MNQVCTPYHLCQATASRLSLDEFLDIELGPSAGGATPTTQQVGTQTVKPAATVRPSTQGQAKGKVVKTRVLI